MRRQNINRRRATRAVAATVEEGAPTADLEAMVKVQRQSLDRISALPQGTIEKILTLMPIGDALRTSILSRRWRYCWRSMQIIVFDDKYLNSSSRDNRYIKKDEIVHAILHVLFLHKAPILEFSISIDIDNKHIVGQIDLIVLDLSSRKSIKKFILKTRSNLNYDNYNCYDAYSLTRYKLPSWFFSLHGLEHLHLTQCVIDELPSTFNGFIMLRSLSLCGVSITEKTLQQLLTNCPLLENFNLIGCQNYTPPRQGNKRTFLKLSKCLRLFFSLHGLKHLHLKHCVIELPLKFNGSIMLRSLSLSDVNINAKTLQQLLTNCPLLENFTLIGCQKYTTTTQGNKDTFLELLLECLLSIQVLKISMSYIKFDTGSMLRLPTTLVHLRILFLDDVCFLKQDEVANALSVISSSPNLEKIEIKLCLKGERYRPQICKDLLDPQGYSGLNLDSLTELEITSFHNYAPEIEFVKLIMSKSPLLKKARIELDECVSVAEENQMLRDFILMPFPRASPTVNFIIERPKYQSMY